MSIIQIKTPLDAVAALALVIGAMLPLSSAQVDSFDIALRKEVLDFGPSPYYRGANGPRVTLSCFLFPKFVVKEFDERQKGAEWVSVIPVKAGENAACTLSHAPREKIIKEPMVYFWGVKGDLIFLIGADGLNGGMPFVVYDSNIWNKVFEDDSGIELEMTSEKSVQYGLRITRAQGGKFSLSYRRVIGTDCDLRDNRDIACWQQLRRKLGLATAQIPVCSSYANIHKDHYASAIAYPVEVSLSTQPTIKAVAGRITCWPVD